MRTLPGWLLAISFISMCLGQDQPQESTGERIHSFRSEIRILGDGTIRATEKIHVTALGDRIQRGIYRDFPTTYPGPFYTRVQVPFRVLGVLRGGATEPYHTEAQSNGIRVYIGDASRLLEAGNYSYQIEYETAFQIGFFEDHDEFYWNVTGNGWEFPLDRVEASVQLPDGIPSDSVSHEAYTGYSGARGGDYESFVNADGSVDFRTTRTLESFEGLTIVVRFPKGFISEPTTSEKWKRYLASNMAPVAAGTGTLLVLGYYLVGWFLVGRDPRRGVITILYSPPLNLPPAELRYVSRMGYDEKCFTAALLDLAVRGQLTIADSDGTFTLTRTWANEDSLPRTESSLLRNLLGKGVIKLHNKQHSTFQKAISDLRLKLKIQFEGTHFKTNRKWLIPGMLLTLLSLLAAVLQGSVEQIFVTGFALLWVTLWTFGVFVLGRGVYQSWREVFAGRRSGVKQAGTFVLAGCGTLFAVPFLLGEVAGLWFLATTTSVLLLPVILALAIVNYLFYRWIKQSTGAGRLLMDQIEGFRRYLAAVEAGPLAVAHPPEKTPELFERYLPYAVALEVENEWAEQFTDALQASSRPDGRQGAHHSPSWYSGSSFDANRLGHFSSGLSSSLGNAVSSASTAPGSGSGGGGGGSSGGGGGGGGGGGW